MLFGDLGLRTVGIPIKLGSTVMTLYGNVTNILADGDGFRLGYDWRGANCIKPCLVHHNVLKKVSGM